MLDQPMEREKVFGFLGYKFFDKVAVPLILKFDFPFKLISTKEHVGTFLILRSNDGASH